MKHHITDETMEYISILAKLELSPEETKQAKKDMETMLQYMDKLDELDTTDVEPMSHIFSTDNVFREDIVTNSNAKTEMLFNAPEKTDDAYVVPKTI